MDEDSCPRCGAEKEAAHHVLCKPFHWLPARLTAELIDYLDDPLEDPSEAKQRAEKLAVLVRKAGIVMGNLAASAQIAVVVLDFELRAQQILSQTAGNRGTQEQSAGETEEQSDVDR